MYEAPRVTEVGNVHSLTLGRALYGNKDNNVWVEGFLNDGNPGTPVGSR